MLIVIPELDDEQVENTVTRFQTVINRTGGEAREPNFWGKRRLAYEIDNRADAFYVVMEFTVGERTLVELKRILRVSDDVLRHMIVKLPENYAGGNEAPSEPEPTEEPTEERAEESTDADTAATDDIEEESAEPARVSE
ncbi:MAG: 30S ribosomal protein S6 [Actinomycetota bacterium]|jgi:small subunit ribosomal protein S6|nr:30S ribosomal protein S6 [Actinomycetota bacterium]